MKQAERTAILDAMSEQFMQPRITRNLPWVEIDGTHGSTWLMLEDVGEPELSELSDDDAAEREIEFYAQYYEGKISSINHRRGYGARLSAPGYMDCTEWTVFDTEEEAEQYLVDTYGDDVEIEEGDDA